MALFRPKTTPPKPAPPEMTDAFLRECGFVIHERPAGGPPTWERDHKVYPQSTAYMIALGERNRMLKQLEAL